MLCFLFYLLISLQQQLLLMNTNQLSPIAALIRAASAIQRNTLTAATMAYKPSVRLTSTHLRVLLALAREAGADREMSKGALAASFGQHPALHTRHLDDLQTKGFIRRRDSPTDRRMQMLKLTPKAAEIIRPGGHLQQVATAAARADGLLSLDEIQYAADLLFPRSEADISQTHVSQTLLALLQIAERIEVVSNTITPAPFFEALPSPALCVLASIELLGDGEAGTKAVLEAAFGDGAIGGYQTYLDILDSEKFALIARAPHPTDSRRNQISRTQRGRELLAINGPYAALLDQIPRKGVPYMLAVIA